MSESPDPNPSKSGKIISIFGSSRPTEDSKEYQEAELLGKKLSIAGFSLCTGGYRGTMEAVSKGASQSEANIIGVTSAIFSPTPNQYVNMQVHTMTLYERLQKLVELGDGYIILKGGIGTLVEFALVWELMNKNIIAKKPIVLVTDFWKPVVDLLSKELAFEGLESCTKYIMTAEDAVQAADIMIASFNK
ncbi:MAG: LOG family protein [Candidatus Kryptoniota bacterium]